MAAILKRAHPVSSYTQPAARL